MAMSDEKLRSLSPSDLRSTYENALARSGSPEADDLISRIEAIGVPASPTSLRLDSVVGRQIHDIVFSSEGKAAAIAAAVDGRAPMEAIDPLLQAKLGALYTAADEGTTQAGYLVANLMKQNFWAVSGKRAKLPAGCIARTAALFVHIPSKKNS